MKTSHVLYAMYKVITAKGIQYDKTTTDAAGAFQNNFHSRFYSDLMCLQYHKLCNRSCFFPSTTKAPLKKKNIRSNLKKYSLTSEGCSHFSEKLVQKIYLRGMAIQIILFYLKVYKGHIKIPFELHPRKKKLLAYEILLKMNFASGPTNVYDCFFMTPCNE